MATFYSKQEKKQGMLFASITLVGVLIVFVSLYFGTHSPIRNILTTQAGTVDNVSVNAGVSFSSDIQYWDSNCSHGWIGDATCDTLVSRIQSCAIGTGSTYCSEYNTYLQQFRSQ